MVPTSAGLVEVDVYPFELEVGVALVGASKRHTMLIADDLQQGQQ